MDFNANLMLMAFRTGVHLGAACLMTVFETSSFTNTIYLYIVSQNNSYFLNSVTSSIIGSS